ncbi:hypothetical protein, partial [Enterococcus casseliflavus]|uniref:hypothetical protein n=1 Tax=Enterococcus casseliflavus TaxID=37734 RepID=UPI003D11A664
LAADLRAKLEASAEGGVDFVAAPVGELVARTNQLLAASGLRGLALDLAPQASGVAPRDLVSLFADEAGEISRQAADRIVEVFDAGRGL